MYSSKPDQIQSEIGIVFRDPKKHDLQPYQLVTSELAPKKKGKVAVFDHDYLVSEYQRAMLSGLCQVPGLKNKEKLRILHLGTGAGIMSNFLISQFGDKIEQLVTIDNNQDMLTIAEKYFGFNPGFPNVISLCQDAHEYVKSYPSSDPKFDIIMQDINCTSEDHSISPPLNFLSDEFLQKLIGMMSEESYLCMNVLYYDSETEQKVKSAFQSNTKNQGALSFL